MNERSKEKIDGLADFEHLSEFDKKVTVEETINNYDKFVD